MTEARQTLPTRAFWHGRRVLLTGHTGFKGAWMALWLAEMGAQTTGFALAPDSEPSLFEQARVGARIVSVIGDLRDRAALAEAMRQARPQTILHLAAQPIVRRAIADPVDTIASNVLGSAHLLDAARAQGGVEEILVVTSDKVYANDDLDRAFREGDPLGGKDPYSASKAATELIVRAFAKTYFAAQGVQVGTARGGNVIGGGDYAEDRIVPDIVRAVARGARLELRMPDATRPWQHVLDCACGYLLYAEALHAGGAPTALNFGPEPGRDMSVRALAKAMLQALGAPDAWEHAPVPGSVEMQTLAVDSSLARRTLGWRDRLAGDALAEWTAAWHHAVSSGADACAETLRQINAYQRL